MKLKKALILLLIDAIVTSTSYAENQTLNNAQWNSLLNIAQQTVLSGGPGVYNARAMTGWEQDDLPGVLRLLENDFENSKSDIVEHPALIPNPAANMVTLPYIIAENENIEVRITNIYGTLILNKTFGNNYPININTEFIKNGAYYVEVNRNNITWFTTKLIILK